jgi:hypothetical protein
MSARIFFFPTSSTIFTLQKEMKYECSIVRARVLTVKLTFETLIVTRGSRNSSTLLIPED